MPLYERARAALGGWPVGWPPSGRVSVRRVVHRAGRLRAMVHGGARPDAGRGGSS